MTQLDNNYRSIDSIILDISISYHLHSSINGIPDLDNIRNIISENIDKVNDTDKLVLENLLTYSNSQLLRSINVIMSDYDNRSGNNQSLSQKLRRSRKN